ncbi:MAG TPA: OB-fold domain-containing protein [Steroidobacteraceae bacterium]|nr:OB-fold domain-containing protein [Steroidobacteraceae bacterium]
MSSAPEPAAPSVVLQRCETCGCLSAPARGFCAACGSHKVLPFAVNGRCVVWSVTSVHGSPYSNQGTASPFGVALVRLDCGVKFMLRVPVGLAIGDRIDIERDGVDSAATLVRHRRGPA